MDAILAMALKDLRLLVRDKLGFFFSFIFPLLIAIFFGGVMSSGGGGGGPSGIGVVVVDEDGTDLSQAFLNDLQGADELDVSTVESRDAAATLVRTGNRTAAIVLPKGFGARRDNPFGGEPATIELGVDPSRTAEAGMLQGLLTKYAFAGFTKSFTDPATVKRQTGLALESIRSSKNVSAADRAVFEVFFASLQTFVDRMPRDAGASTEPSAGSGAGSGTPAAASPAAEFSPVRIEEFPVTRQRRGPANAFAITFPQGIVWGVMGCAYGFAVSLSLERTRGTLLRLRAAPLPRWGIVGGKAVACFLAVCSVCTVLLLIAALGFGVRPEAPLLLAPAVMSTAVCFVGVMMGLAVLGGRSESSGNLGWAVLLVLSMIGGGMIPLLFLPPWMQTMSVVSPVRWSILALEGALWRGFTPAQMLLPCAVLCGMGVACFALGARLFRWTQEG
jgi:ABC-2 type transport system permease protein